MIKGQILVYILPYTIIFQNYNSKPKNSLTNKITQQSQEKVSIYDPKISIYSNALLVIYVFQVKFT